ncbi:precorrin-6A reductase [Methanobrevibacter sp. DSM 116169]|uniref:precorrin-6A reductase n=1 Tax=Methanobrevibacter sp. DSM 116169 TaxID=3242727 RepID=UPI0038FC5DB8
MQKLNIFLLGGTRDSINIIKYLKENFNTYILTTTTTEYGSSLAIEAGSDDTIAKPLPKKDILEILEKSNFDLIIDATHPFASHITGTAIECSKIMKIPYIRFERPISDDGSINHDKLHKVNSFVDAGKLISKNFNQFNVLHLAGTNTIEDVVKSVPKENFYARILKIDISIKKCEDLEIPKENISFMNGVSSAEENIELIKKTNAKVVISKESGKTGGLPEKIEACKKLNVDFILITRPVVSTLNENDIVRSLEELNNKLRTYF